MYHNKSITFESTQNEMATSTIAELWFGWDKTIKRAVKWFSRLCIAMHDV